MKNSRLVLAPLLLACVAGAASVATGQEPSRGEVQLEALMADRPGLARSLANRPAVRTWIMEAFNKASPPLFWDDSPPVSGRMAEFDARNPEKTFLRIRERAAGIDQLTVLIFELHNEQGYEVFESIFERAERGEVSREEFAILCLEQEFRALLQVRQFLADNLDDLTSKERSEARRYYRLRRGPGTLEEHLQETLDRGFDLRDHFRRLYDTEVLPSIRK